MFVNDVHKKEEIKASALRHLRKYGIKFRLKNNKTFQIARSKKFFNVPLQNLENKIVTLQNGQQLVVPKRLYEICCFILSNVETEGIFRKEGSKSRQNEIKLYLDRGCMLSNEHHVIDIAAVFKSFLRQLPEPLIPYAFHELFLRCSLIEKSVEAILLACLLLPTEHLNALCYVLQFLFEVSTHAKMNKMNSSNLSLVVGPNIFPVNEKVTPKNKLMIKKICEIVKVLIENAKHVGIIPDYIIEYIASPKSDNIQTVSKTKRRRSGSLTRIFSGLKKMVGNKIECSDVSVHTVTPDLLLTPSLSSIKSKANDFRIILDKTKQKEPQKKTMLERRWSAITSATNLKRKKRDSVNYTSSESTISPQSDYVRVFKSEYEEIKSRVSAIEKRLSLEMDNIKPTVIHNEVNIIHDIQSAYEQTLEQAEPLSPGTDQLARRLSKELRIRNSREKIIRSPSARKIGNIRRRSRESERPCKISKSSTKENDMFSNRGNCLSLPSRNGVSNKLLTFHSSTILPLKNRENIPDYKNTGRYVRSNTHVLDIFDSGLSPTLRNTKTGTKRSSSFSTYDSSPVKMKNDKSISPRRSLDTLNKRPKNPDSVTCTPKMPQIKRAMPISKTPKRLCITPCSVRTNTPVKVIPNKLKVYDY